MKSEAVIKAYEVYDEIAAIIKQDEELTLSLNNVLTEDCDVDEDCCCVHPCRNGRCSWIG